MTLLCRLAVGIMQLIIFSLIHVKAWICYELKERVSHRVVLKGVMPYFVIWDSRAMAPFIKAGTMIIAVGTWISRGSWILKFSVRMELWKCEMAVKNTMDVLVGMPQSNRRKLARWAGA